MKDNEIPTRADYRHFVPLTTRWADNDVYGHVNNVTYYAYFDTAANRYLIDAGGLDIHRDPVLGIVVESMCRYHAPIAFPEAIEAGVRVDRLGKRAVTYGIGIFREGEDAAAAHGHFVHVFVTRDGHRPTAIPDKLRQALEAIRMAD
jgi:acyl-CoA thioester hydrolase